MPAEGNGRGQRGQGFALPTIQAVVVDLDDPLAMGSPNHELGGDLVELGQDLLVVQARIGDEAPMGGAPREQIVVIAWVIS